MNAPYTLPFDDSECNADQVPLVGGKNASLGELVAAGDAVTVPPGFAVTTAFYEAFLSARDLDDYVEGRIAETDVGDAGAVEDASADIRARITDAPFPDALADELETAWEALRERTPGDEFEVAVRSSATAEDLPDASFAGQQDTYLNVRGFERVKRRTRECMASLFTPRAIAYREENGFDHDDVLISVGVQAMVDARSSGVMFTVNPANGDRSKVRIESNWGLGEAVVSGEVTPDSFLVDKPVYSVVERNISEKRVMTVSTEDGTTEAPIEDERRDEPSLTDDEITELTDVAKAIERHYGEPQDIEWALSETGGEHRIYVLQSRPETTWREQTESGSPSPMSDSQSTAERILDRL